MRYFAGIRVRFVALLTPCLRRIVTTASSSYNIWPFLPDLSRRLAVKSTDHFCLFVFPPRPVGFPCYHTRAVSGFSAGMYLAAISLKNSVATATRWF